MDADRNQFADLFYWLFQVFTAFPANSAPSAVKILADARHDVFPIPCFSFAPLAPFAVDAFIPHF
jgi:hypothetical protein